MKQLVIIPGGFHPFHAGHAALYQSAQAAFPGADVYVAATNDTSQRPFPFAIKEKLAKLAGVEAGHFVQVKSPFRAEEIVHQFDPNDTQLIFVRSEKDANKPPQGGGTKKDGSPSYLQPLGDNAQPLSQHAYMAYLPTVEFGPGMTSATEIRGAWPNLNEKRKTALVMSLYPATQKNPKLAATVVKMLDTAMGAVDESALGDLPRPNKRNQFKSLHRLRKQRGLDEHGMAEGSMNEFALPGGGDGDSGRWYTDDELADIIGDDWFEDFDVSHDEFNIDTHGEKAKQNLASYANSWFDDKGYNVNVVGVEHNDVDHDLKWYIVGSFHNPRFAEQGVAEGYTDDDIETTKQFRNAIAGLKAKSAVDKAKDGVGAKYYADGAKVTPQETARRAAERKAQKDKKGVAEGLDEAVGGNYLYHATSADGLKGMLSSGSIRSATGPQAATSAQTRLPTVSVTRDWGYASGAQAQSQLGGIGRDAILVLDRNTVESNFKTLGTSQSTIVKGLSLNPYLSKDGKARSQNTDPMARANAKAKMKYAEPTTKAGGEFEEAVVVPKGALPLKGTMVGFWVNPKSELMKDPAIMNDPRRLDMIRPNQFVKATKQGVAEGPTADQRAFFAGADSNRQPKWRPDPKTAKLNDIQLIIQKYKKLGADAITQDEYEKLKLYRLGKQLYEKAAVPVVANPDYMEENIKRG